MRDSLPQPTPGLTHDRERPQGVAPDRIAPQRIAKVLARAGLCSRRDAERWIAEGRVAVDGTVLTTPAVTVTPDSNIRVDGKPLPQPERARLWRYHKPAGLVTTHRDEKGRPTVFAALPAGLPRLISIGRLDLSSEGLLLLTNDGALARRLELPATGWVRRYKVRVHGDVEPGRLAALADGITVDRVSYGPIRLAYGPFQLGHLARGMIEEVPGKVLQEQLGVGGKGARGRHARKTVPA